MASESVLRVVAFGNLNRNLLQQVRRELELEATGRLDDREDAEFGVRRIMTDSGQTILRLWRDAEDTWSLSVSYWGTRRPSDEFLDEYSAKFRTAFTTAGLTIDREWRLRN
jgi:hypothetical protein